MADSDYTVYVVDDDAAMLKAVSRMLRSAGFKVTAFGSAQAFLEGFNPRS